MKNLVRFALSIGLIFSFVGNAADICDAYTMTESVAPSQLERGAQSFLWKVHHENGASNYLLGTIHTDDREVIRLWQALTVLFLRLKYFVSEMNYSTESEVEFSRLTMTNEPELSQALGEELYGRAVNLPHFEHFNKTFFARLKPWAAFFSLLEPQATGLALDAYLYQEAAKAGLEAIALQSSRELVAAVENLKVSEHVQIARETICNHEKVLKQVERLKGLYVKGDVQEFVNESGSLRSRVPGLTSQFTKALVEDRNKVFLLKLEPLLSKGSAFVAVGAAHLYGDKGLLAMLKTRGYSLEPIDQNTITEQLLQQAQAESDSIVNDLVDWLKIEGTTRFVNGFSTPSIEVVTSAELEQMACGGRCSVNVFSMGSKIYVSIEIYQEFLQRVPRTMTELVAHIVRLAQLAEIRITGDNNCQSWLLKNVQSIIVQSRYLTSRGLASAGLDPLTRPIDCTL